jgi:hypothetical protein
MGLTASITKAVDGAFNALGDLPTTVTVKLPQPSIYDPTTGTTSATLYIAIECQAMIVGITLRELAMIKSTFEASRIAGVPEKAIKKCLIKAGDFDEADAPPTEDTLIELVENNQDIVYRAVRVDLDPSRSLYTIYVEAT